MKTYKIGNNRYLMTDGHNVYEVNEAVAINEQRKMIQESKNTLKLKRFILIAEKYYAVPYSTSLNAEPAGIALNSSGFIAYYDGSTLPTGKMIYPLADPFLVTTLTPTQLKTLRGTNNIWSNSNGNLEVAYWKH